MRRHITAFGLAFSGIWYAWRTQPNFVVHSLFTALVIGLGVTLEISHVEWVALLLTVILVFVAEMINTSIESMTNLITTEHRKNAKIAKDVSAGMVLTAVIGAIIIGLVIFAPKILR